MPKKRRRPALLQSHRPKPVKNPTVQIRADMSMWDFLRLAEKISSRPRRSREPVL